MDVVLTILGFILTIAVVLAIILLVAGLFMIVFSIAAHLDKRVTQ